MEKNQYLKAKTTRSVLPKLRKKITLDKENSPFAIPQDAEIFKMKQKEKYEKKQQKNKRQNMKIWEKGVKKQGITIKDLKELGKEEKNQQENQTKRSLIEAAQSAIKNRVKMSEPMHEFINKKRQTLLFQMLIDLKRQKVNEFEELTKLHRKGLQRAEKMLEEDMETFNNYLNQNKREAREAIKKAEHQTRQKNEKVAIIKEKLEVQADLTGKNMSKRQTLQNLRKYKLFLDSLNPDIKEQERKKIMEMIEKEQQQTQNFGGISLSENLDDSEEDQGMYFKQPSQLIDIFHSLEQSNLSLITHLKEMEQEIEETKGQFNEKKQALAKKKNQLILSKEEIMKQILQVDEEIQQLKKTTNKDQISIHYSSLEVEIIKMSKEIGFISAEQKNFTILDLLKDIEHNIQKQLEFLQSTKKQNPTAIHSLQKICFNDKKERKQLKMKEEMEQKALKQKLESSPKRQKRTGRVVMERSIIKKQEKKKEVEIAEPQQEIEKRKYLT